jgi:hypothetical protein
MATSVSQLPVLLISCPMKKSRKFRTVSEWNLRLMTR